MVQVDLAAQVNIGRLAQADVVFHEGEALALQNQAVGQGAQTNANQAGDASQEKEKGLLQNVPAQTGGLGLYVIAQGASPSDRLRRFGLA